MSELNWVYTAMVLLVASLIAYAVRLFHPGKWVHEMGWGLMLLSLVCLVVSMVIRSMTAQYFALANMYESLLMVCMLTQAAFLVFDRWFALRALGLPVAILLLISLSYNLTLPTDVAPLQPALQSYWRSIHVPIILLSYALFTLAFLASVVYLIKYYWERGRKNLPGSPAPATVGPSDLERYFRMETETASNDPTQAMEGVFTAETSNIYDEITYRSVIFGFPLLALGIVLGGMWANEAWGNYWSWDPKESMSLVMLLGYGVYLHMRVNGEHSPKTLAIVSVVGFVLMMITYFGVNLMGLGMHSYGQIG